MSSVRSPSRRVRYARIALSLALGVVLSCITAELVLRYLVYHPEASLGGLGEHVRVPQDYGDMSSDDDTWKLQFMWVDPAHAVGNQNPDPLVGWTNHLVAPGTYEHAELASLNGRTPVLFYGDSFAQCNTSADECFQSLLERSDLADRYRLLNFGVGGYGFDQIYLLLAHSIDRYAALDPVVIVSLLLEDDLDRSLLTFRGWPKPRLQLVDGVPTPTAPVVTDPHEYLRLNPIAFPSFLWRFLLFKEMPALSGLQKLLRGDTHRVAEKRELNRAILAAIERLLAERRLRHFVLLFHVDVASLAPVAKCDWQEPLVVDTCRELSIPLVDTRPYLAAAAKTLKCDAWRFYGRHGVLNGHLNALGNAIAFEAIRQGLRGDFAAPDIAHLERWLASGDVSVMDAAPQPMDILGRSALVSSQSGANCVRIDRATDPTDPSGGSEECLFVHGGDARPTIATIALDGATQRFSAFASVVERPGAPCTDAPLELEVRVDGKTAWHAAVARGTRVSIEIDLAGARELALVAGARGIPSGCAWLRLAHPRIE
jgi:hypothetical protein